MLGWCVTKCIDVLERGECNEACRLICRVCCEAPESRPFAVMLAIKYIPVLHVGRWLFLHSVSGSRELVCRTVKDSFSGGVSAVSILVT